MFDKNELEQDDRFEGDGDKRGESGDTSSQTDAGQGSGYRVSSGDSTPASGAGGYSSGSTSSQPTYGGSPYGGSTGGSGGSYGSAYSSAYGGGYGSGGGYNPYNPYSYGTQPPYNPPPSGGGKKPKKQKKGSAGLVVAVVVLSFLLVVGGVTAAVYFLTDRSNPTSPGIPNDVTSEPAGGGGGDNSTDSGSTQTPSHQAGDEGGDVQYGGGSGFADSAMGDDAVSNAAVFCSKSVVAITTSAATYNPFYGNYVTQGAGSGVLFAEQTDEAGAVSGTYVITNNHVVEGASEITVTLPDGTQYTADLVGTDAQTDVAVVFIGATDQSDAIASIGDSSTLVLGQSVIAIGNPLGELAGTVTNGIISCLEREIDIDGVKMNLLQTNAAVNPGNSGGGLFSLDGKLIGMVNAKSSGENIEGLGFAIPVNTVKEIAGELIENGYITGRPKIGISGYEVTADNYQSFRTSDPDIYSYIEKYYYANGEQLLEGWYITDASGAQLVNPDNGFQKGDVVSEIDGARVMGQSSITEILNSHAIGDTVTVTVWRLSEEGGRFRPSYSITSVDIEIVLSAPTPPQG